MRIAILLLALLPACAPEADLRMEAGRAVFLEQSTPTCATCHVLADAGAEGVLGPNLDTLKPDTTRIVNAVTNGIGIMPAQQGVLSAKQISDVAYYISQTTQTQ